jgi:hypothetical protein
MGLARQAGFGPAVAYKEFMPPFERFAALVAEAEREACARMVTDCAWALKGPEAAVAVEACAAAIRARGET